MCLVFAIPFAALATWLSRGDRQSGAAPWLILFAIGGFILGSGVAAWTQRRRLPLMHATVCAVLTYLAAQSVFIIVRLLSGGSVRWMSALFNLTMVAFAGLVGGGLASAMTKRGLVPSERPQ